MQLDVESLRTLIAVVDTGGMTRAAERLGLSQSAVSWKIKRLEERVGRPLLIRDGRRLRPSRDGEELLEHAHTIVESHDAAVARLSSTELSGRVRIGATEEISTDVLGEVIGRFDRIHPDVTIEVHVDRSLVLDPLLRKGQLDVALVQVDRADIVRTDTVLFDVELHWISSPVWTYEEGSVPLVTFGRHGFYRPLAEEILDEAGIPYRIAFSGPSSASVLAAVEAGLGVAVVSAWSLTDGVVAWPRAAGLPPLPVVHQVARAAPGERSDIVTELIAELVGRFSTASVAVPPRS